MRHSRVPGLVSVIVPNYNKAAYLTECLDSIAGQSYSKWELLIIDDQSDDHSRKVIEEWMAGSSIPASCSAIYVPLPRNVGYSGALTLGYFLSRGEFIAVQDSDDWSHRERLQKQVDYLRSHPDYDLVGTNYTAIKYDESGTPKYIVPRWLRYGDDILASYNKGGHCVCHGTMMFRGKLFDDMGGLTRKVDGAEDYDFIARCVSAKYKINNLKEVLYYYRLHPDQRSLEYYSRKGGK